MNRPYQQMAELELAHWPGVQFRVEVTGRHEKVFLTYAGRTQFLVRPATPSDHRGPKKHACDIKRKLREMGAQRA